MKAWILLLLGALLVPTAPLLQAQSPADAGTAGTPWVGSWQDAGNAVITEFAADGKLSLRSPDPSQPNVDGTWHKSDADDLTLLVDLSTNNGDQTVAMAIEFTSDDEMQVTFGDEERTMRRLTGEIDSGAVVGTWAATASFDGTDEQHHLVRRADGTGFGLERYIDPRLKIYATDAYSFTWRIFGQVLIETHSESDALEETYDVLYWITEIGSENATYEVIDESFDEPLDPISDTRTTAGDLPAPPEGHALKDIDKFWELQEAG